MVVRKLLVRGLCLLCAALACEAGSSYLLFRYYAHTANDFYPEGSATVLLARKLVVNRLLHRYPTPEWSADVLPLYVPNARTGYTTAPGRYYITQVSERHAHRFRLTVVSPGRRAAAPWPVQAPRRLYVMGDSSVYGWGLDDEQTMPWLLQSRLAHDEVVNLTMTGYSTIVALEQLRDLDVGQNDRVVVAYQQATTAVNVSAAEWIRGFPRGMEVALGVPGRMRDIEFPYGLLDEHGQLAIRRMKLSCEPARVGDYCRQPPMASEQAAQVSTLAFEALHRQLGARLIVAFVTGGDDDPVIAAVRARGIDVADLRGDVRLPESHDVVPYDDHPGPFRHRAMADALLAHLQAGHSVASPPQQP
jgi:hypothetical protein